jgi:hypothetical protein
MLCSRWQLLFLECGFCPETFVLFRVVYWVCFVNHYSVWQHEIRNPKSAIRNSSSRIANFVVALAAAFLRVRFLPRDFRALSSCLLGLFRESLFRLAASNPQSAIRNPKFFQPLCFNLRNLCNLRTR